MGKISERVMEIADEIKETEKNNKMYESISKENHVKLERLKTQVELIHHLKPKPNVSHEDEHQTLFIGDVVIYNNYFFQIKNIFVDKYGHAELEFDGDSGRYYFSNDVCKICPHCQIVIEGEWVKKMRI